MAAGVDLDVTERRVVKICHHANTGRFSPVALEKWEVCH
jgi:hypothetical protein